MDQDSLQYDILREIFNIGVGKASGRLSQLLHKRIIFDVARISFTQTKQWMYRRSAKLLGAQGWGELGTLMLTKIAFSNELEGRACFLVPSDKMRAIINLSLEEDFDPEGSIGFTDVDLGVIKELGNIILDGIVAELADVLGKSLSYSLPTVRLIEPKQPPEEQREEDVMSAISMGITYHIEGIKIEGAVIVALEPDSYAEVRRILSMMEEELYG